MQVEGPQASASDIEAILALTRGTPASDPRRTHALRLLRACEVEPPASWLAPTLAPLAWELVAVALEAGGQNVVVESSEHSGGQHQDIVISCASPESQLRLFLTWTSGRLTSDGDHRPLDTDYSTSLIAGRGPLERAVRTRFAVSAPAPDPNRLAAARLLVALTDLPSGMELSAADGPAARHIWSAGRIGDTAGIEVDMSSGRVLVAGEEQVDAAFLLRRVAEPACFSNTWRLRPA